MANSSRFHIEVNSIKVDEMDVRFNIFGDTLAQVTADLEQVIGYVTGNPQPAPQPPARKPVQPKLPAAPAVPQASETACCSCGSLNLEWVTGVRKSDQRPFAAFKCRDCGKWQPEAKL